VDGHRGHVHIRTVVGKRGHLYPLGSRSRFRVRPADFSLCPSFRRLASNWLAKQKLVAQARDTLAGRRNGVADDRRLFGLLLPGYAHGITPGLLATLLGVQPILTLLLTERRFSIWRLLGLLLALTGLMLVFYQSLILAKLSGLGMGFGFCALLCMTFGAVLQKRVQQAPA
jgi:hypothetical protein